MPNNEKLSFQSPRRRITVEGTRLIVTVMCQEMTDDDKNDNGDYDDNETLQQQVLV